MARGKRESPATRVAGAMPLLLGLASAVALTGAAFFTVHQAGCAQPGSYIRHDHHVELIGGCLDPAELPGKPATRDETAGQPDQTGHHRP